MIIAADTTTPPSLLTRTTHVYNMYTTHVYNMFTAWFALCYPLSSLLHLMLQLLVNSITALPAMLSALDILWMQWIIVPLLSLPFAALADLEAMQEMAPKHVSPGTPPSKPLLSHLLDLWSCHSGHISFQLPPILSRWDVSNVTNMYSMFWHAIYSRMVAN